MDDGANHPADRAATEVDPDAAATLERAAARLVEAADASVVGWVVRAVEERLPADVGLGTDAVLGRAHAAGEQARREVVDRLRALVGTDVDHQSVTPLQIVRDAVRHPTAVLADADVPPVRRDAWAERSFPADVYDLSPASLGDVDPSLHEPGLVWGAAKAKLILARRRAEGRL